MDNGHTKRCSTSLVIREKQIKTTMRYHLTPVRMVIIKKTTTTEKTSVGEGVEKTLVHCWWECEMVPLVWKTVGRFLKNVKIELPCDPAIPLLGRYAKELKTGS